MRPSRCLVGCALRTMLVDIAAPTRSLPGRDGATRLRTDMVWRRPVPGGVGGRGAAAPHVGQMGGAAAAPFRWTSARRGQRTQNTSTRAEAGGCRVERSATAEVC